MSLSKFWLIDGFSGDRRDSWQIGGPTIDYENHKEYAVYETYTIDIYEFCELCRGDSDYENAEEDDEVAWGAANEWADGLLESCRLLTEWLYDDIFFIARSNHYGYEIRLMVVAPVDPIELLQDEYRLTTSSARKCVEIAKRYSTIDFKDAVRGVLGTESAKLPDSTDPYELDLDWDWLLDLSERFEGSMSELNDFKKRCSVEKGSLTQIDSTGLYTIDHGEYADENIAVFKSEPKSFSRYVFDRKNRKVWFLRSGWRMHLENRPAFHLCRYIAAVYSENPGKERQKAAALEALFSTLGEPISNAKQFVEPLARVGCRKEALILAL